MDESNEFGAMSFIKRAEAKDCKKICEVLIDGKKGSFFVPASGVPDLYIEGYEEPIIKVDIEQDGEGEYVLKDLIEDPSRKDILAQLPDERYQYYIEEVQSYIRKLNREE
ncbi:hypothetical protein GYA13_04140 [Candidatus Kuenenbacteria bacterium]|nr:hypothetical protein [Candidatus Kuenenbacteria bacterium]